MKTRVLVNVGCGAVFHPAWTNLDLVPADPLVQRCDILGPLPFSDNNVDVCYSSHVLEHLRKDEADHFIAEQYRVLNQGGIIRVAVPDLEGICVNYLTQLTKLVSGEESDPFCYDYTLLELFDQLSRESSGGELYAFIKNLPNLDAKQREFLNSRLRLTAFDNHSSEKSGVVVHSLWMRFLAKWQRLRYGFAEMVVRCCLGDKAARSLRRGLFRDSGEVHHLMYDRYSLYRLLASHGFREIRAQDANCSVIPDFPIYSLEIVDAVSRKPDSLYMEAVKP
jgi:predicted SAM-dependent methyltransferase